ncbi:MAG: leucine-rich repeat protein [Clostridia bacterium]|nr:leucine-rich repeat protein [Clostridia bacterium]
MKKAILLAITLSLFLSGCGKREESTEALSNEDVPTLESVAVSAAEQKATYYQEKAAALEAELLALKASFYEERVAYEQRIDALETALSAGAEADESSFTYTVIDGRATVTGYQGRATAVVIPPTLGGAPVAVIADRAFEGNVTLTSLTVPDGVTYIGWFACSGCTALQSVSLPASLSHIEYGAFLNCPSTMTVFCPADSYAARYAESYGFAVK